MEISILWKQFNLFCVFAFYSFFFLAVFVLPFILSLFISTPLRIILLLDMSLAWSTNFPPSAQGPSQPGSQGYSSTGSLPLPRTPPHHPGLMAAESNAMKMGFYLCSWESSHAVRIFLCKPISPHMWEDQAAGLCFGRCWPFVTGSDKRWGQADLSVPAL